MRRDVVKKLSIFLTLFLLPLGLARGEQASELSTQKGCKAIIELLGPKPDLSWIKADYRFSAAREKIRPNQIDETHAVEQLPKELKAKLKETDEKGFLKNKMTTLAQLRNWAEREIKKRILNLTRAPEGLRQFDLWMHDMNGHDGGFAIRQLLKPDIGYFGVGHGNAGGDLHALYPFATENKPLVEVIIDVDKIIEIYSKLPGVRKSRFIFYKTCSGGLPGEKSEADAVRLSRATGVPVVAPMGVLVNNGRVISEKKRHWETSVENEKTEERLPEDEAFRIFMPNGESKPVTFEKMKELIIRDEFHSRVTYGEN